MAGQFVAKLIERQGTLTGAAFASLLGISEADWSRIRRGQREPSKRIQQAALARWPELTYWLAADAQAAQGDNVEAQLETASGHPA